MLKMLLLRCTHPLSFPAAVFCTTRAGIREVGVTKYFVILGGVQV
jgi:hypothetical protein